MNLEVNNAPWSNEGVDVEQTLHLIEVGQKRFGKSLWKKNKNSLDDKIIGNTIRLKFIFKHQKFDSILIHNV